MSLTPPRYAEILDAADRIEPEAVPTPLLSFPALDARVGGRVLLKAECAQTTGSFKFRGALNRMRRIAAGSRAAGVVAYSSGNHAQAVAAVAKLLNMPAVIVMPSDAPAVKIAGTRGHGAEVVLYDRDTEDREAIGSRIAAERGATIVPPYEDRGRHRRPGHRRAGARAPGDRPGRALRRGAGAVQRRRAGRRRRARGHGDVAGLRGSLCGARGA